MFAYYLNLCGHRCGFLLVVLQLLVKEKVVSAEEDPCTEATAQSSQNRTINIMYSVIFLPTRFENENAFVCKFFITSSLSKPVAHLAGSCLRRLVSLLLSLLLASQVSDLPLLPAQTALVLRLESTHSHLQLLTLLLQFLVLLLQLVFGG